MKFDQMKKQDNKKRCRKPLPVPEEILPSRLYRLSQIIPYHIPISRSAWYSGIKKGKYPKPEHLGPRTAVWRGSDLIPIMQGAAD